MHFYGRFIVLLGVSILCILGTPAQQVARTVVTFPEELTALWPGDDGKLLAETRGHLFLWPADGVVREVATLDENHRLPETTIGWSPTRLALLTPQDTRTATESTLSLIFPGPERLLTLPNGWRTDLCEQAGVFLWYTTPPNWEFVPPWSAQLIVYDLNGKRLPGWTDATQGEFHAACAQVDGRWRIALTADSPQHTTCWLLDAKAKPVWKRELPTGWKINEIAFSAAANTIILAANRTEPFASELWLINAGDGQLHARLTLPQEYLRGMQLSRNGQWAVVWTWPHTVLCDVMAQRIRWQTPVGLIQDDWLGFLDADVRDDGSVVALYGDHTREAPVTMYTFDEKGAPTARWTSPMPLQYAAAPRGRSLFIAPNDQEVLMRSGRDIISLPLPQAALHYPPADRPETVITTILHERQRAKLLADLQSNAVQRRQAAQHRLRSLAPMLREEIAGMLGRQDNRFSIETLSILMSDVDAYVRIAAIQSLVAMHDTSVVPILLNALPDTTDFNAHLAVITALGTQGDARAVSPLMEIIHRPADPNRPERKAAIASIVQLGAISVPALMQAMADPEWHDGSGLIQTMLGAIGEPAVEPLLALLKNTDVRIRRRAVIALGETRSPRAFPAILLALDDVETRTNAAYALQFFADTRAVAPLIAVLNDPDSTTRHYAAWALRVITNQDFGEDAARWRAWSQAQNGIR